MGAVFVLAVYSGVVQVSALALTRAQAAALCELTPTGFDSWVRRGIVPGPITGTRRWSKAALERAISGVAKGGGNVDDPEAVFNEWLKSHAG